MSKKRKKKAVIVSLKSSPKLLTKFYKYLDTIYLNERRPSSFSGPMKLYKEVQRLGLYFVKNVDLIEDYLNGIPVYGLYKGSRKKFKHPPVIISSLNVQAGVDLMSIQRDAKYNNNYTFVLVVIDAFSKVVWTKLLKNKQAKTVADAMDDILSNMSEHFVSSCQDRGVEFGELFDKVLKKYNIKKFYAGAGLHCSIVERVIRTLRGRIARYKEHNNTDKFYDVLDDIVSSYNNTYHSSIKMVPNNVTHGNAYIVFENLYSKRLNFSLSKYLKPYKFKLGASVRIALHKGVFKREFQERYSKEVFQISRRYKFNGVELYKVNDCNNETIKSSFYAPELTVVRQNDRNKYKIDKIHDEEMRGNTSYVLVTFEGAKCKEWIPKQSITVV